MGKDTNEVERLVCEKIGCQYAVALSAGAVALHVAVWSAGVKPGDRVFCLDTTFDAMVNPAIYENGVSVLVDMEYDTWSMDPIAPGKVFEAYLEVRVTVAAHLYGTLGKIGEIQAICQRYDAITVEDMAELLGASYEGVRIGTPGHYSAILFNGNKIITGSSGGMLLTDDLEAANKVRK